MERKLWRVGWNATHLDITRSPVKVQMQVFDLSIICKLLVYIFFRRLFVYVRDEDYPSFYRCASHDEADISLASSLYEL